MQLRERSNLQEQKAARLRDTSSKATNLSTRACLFKKIYLLYNFLERIFSPETQYDNLPPEYVPENTFPDRRSTIIDNKVPL
ncbi:hypothetical protein K020075H21_09360 [Bacteroides ovatus]|jgi:hypothetical protein